MIFDKEIGMVVAHKVEEKINRLHSNDSNILAVQMFEHRDLYLNREELSRLTGIAPELVKARINTLRANGFLFENASPSTKVPGRWKMIGIKDTVKPAVPRQENNKFGNLLNSVFGMGELNYEG
ncbi:conserved hypothetical protein [Vibrio phage 199E37-1]|nr:conserved hypothetical protein [Vibrio phage 199E37-1]